MTIRFVRPLVWALALLLLVASVVPNPAFGGTVGSRDNLSRTAESARPIDLDQERRVPAHHCGSALLATSRWTVPGWYPAAESVTVYTIGAIATYLYARFVRIAPPWWVSHGSGALWAAIEASWITGRFIPGDVVSEYNYENCHGFTAYKYHYRNGALYRSAVRSIPYSSCAQVNNLVRGILRGTTTVNPGARFKLNCPTSYGP